ncbi:MAG: rhomboid family intramembrane serine protease [Methyloceanibacter sp.]|nr:rhomboid family intramembrane serine protease [Methyloceanibacter sp.]
MPAREPILNVPRAVTLAAGAMIAMQLVLSVLPRQQGLEILLSLAMIPARYTGAATELPGGYISAATSFVTYTVVHGGWLHLTINVLWMLAFGTAVARRVSLSGFFKFSVLCGVVGALAHLVLHWGAITPMVGASAAISGQMAAALRFIFNARGSPHGPLPDFAHVPLASLNETLRDGRIVGFIVFWLVLNAYFGMSGASFGTGPESQIAWEAHIGGFLCGLLTFGYFDAVRPEPDVSQLR